MSELTLTAQQNMAINAHGSSVLVSAGAGSGKTFVLVQRLLARIMDESSPCNIDDFLIITYTRAAAADLRTKIRKELGNRLASNPQNVHLQKQLQLIHSAKIGTTHSFCAALLRQWAGKIGIDPAFRIMDEDESNMLLAKLCSRLLDERYENADADFLRLVDTLGSGRDDAKLAESTISLYKKLQSLPDPEAWIAGQKALLQEDNAEPSNTLWGKSLMEKTASTAAHCARLARQCLELLTLAPDIHEKYAPAISDDEAAFLMIKKRFDEGAKWDDFAKAVKFDFTKLNTVRKPSDPDLKERVSDIRKAYKALWASSGSIFELSANDVMTDNSKVNAVLCSMLDLCLDLSTAFKQKKRALSIMDYSDLEHISLELLSDGSNLAAKEVSSRFAEVLVDEYQDTNEIQDNIFKLISDNGKKLFMVGDVKQSIYRFRLAEPEIFIEKYSAFKDYDKAQLGESIRIDLNSNFRSDPEVLSFVNRVFLNTMTSSVGGVDYSDRDALHPHNPPAGVKTAAYINVIDTKNLSDDDGNGISRAEAEALYTAKCIAELIKNGDDDARTYKAGDIAILLRSDKALGPIYASALAGHGIASETAQSEDPAATPEGAALICLLRIIDNPRQDIPLITVLHSPVGGFSPEELATMRVDCRTGSMYEALVAHAAADTKSANFLKLLTELRALSRTVSCDELIWQIFCKTNIREIYSCMTNGEERRANLESIYDYARACASKGHSTLFLMLRDLEESIKKGLRLAGKSSESSDTVKIMSIHRSKGLEFPVVFVCDCARAFSNKDVEDSLLSHKKLGLAARLVDMDKMISCDTAARLALKDAILDEQKSEEMRILYVALTRAKKLLHMNISSRYAQNAMNKAIMGAARSDDASSMADWILAAALKGQTEAPASGCTVEGEDFILKNVPPEDITKPQETLKDDLDAKEENSGLDAVKQKLYNTLIWDYPWSSSELIPSKLTATQLKGRQTDAEAAENAPSPPPSGGFERPSFVTRRKGLSATERGTALHLAMQYIDYSRCSDEHGVKNEIDRLLALEQLTEEQAESIPCDKIAHFFKSDIGIRLTKGDLALREFKFSLLKQANEFFPEAHPEDSVLLQGVVDVCFEYDGKLCVLDFKTDNIRPGGEADRALQYEGQIRAYGAALEKILKKKVDKLLLYFFATDTFYEVKP